MIVRPANMNSLTVVSEGANFAFVKIEMGIGENFFGRAPGYLLDDWRWKCDRERCIAEAREWVKESPGEGLIRYEGVLFCFGPSCETYQKKTQLPKMIRLAFEWLWAEVMDHDLNLNLKNQAIFKI